MGVPDTIDLLAKHKCVPVNLRPTPYTLHPYTLHPAPCTLHPTPFTLGCEGPVAAHHDRLRGVSHLGPYIINSTP